MHSRPKERWEIETGTEERAKLGIHGSLCSSHAVHRMHNFPYSISLVFALANRLRLWGGGWGGRGLRVGRYHFVAKSLEKERGRERGKGGEEPKK